MSGGELTRDEAAQRARTVRVHGYQVLLDVTGDAQTFDSTTVLRFDAVPGSSTFLDLIADRVHEVTLNGRPVDLRAVGDGRIALVQLAAGNEVRVVARCAYSRSGEGLHRFVDPVDGEVYLYSQFEIADARRVFACFDQPDLKASFTFTVTAPAGWQVLSNQRPERVVDAGPGRAVWHFPPTPPLPTYVTALVAGPYAGVPGTLTTRDGRRLPTGVWCRASLRPHLDADEVAAITAAGLAHFEEVFDTDFPFAKYDQVFVPEFNAGAMENAGLVTLTESYVFRSPAPDAMHERRAVTVLHELAHMWFGDLVTMRWWDDLWLNESFAEYVSTVATEATTRWTQAWATFGVREKSWAYQQDQLSTTHPVVADMRDLGDVEVNFDGITYAKGAAVLRQLVAWVGEAQFLAGVRSYFARYAWGTTTAADLLAELERTSGRDLGAWSAHWLSTAGVPLLRTELVVSDGVIDQLAVLQTPAAGQAPPPHRLAIGGYDVVDGRLTRTWVHELDVAGTRTPVPELAGRRRPALLLLNDGDLAYAKVRLDLESTRVAWAWRHTLTDPTARALLWGLLWDRTRDGEVPPSAFVAAVGQSVAVEPDSSQALVMLRQVATTLTQWVPGPDRPALSARFAALVLEVAADPAVDPDLRRQCLSAAARHAWSDAVLDRLAGLLDGSAPLAGLDLDADLRWELVTALVVAGRAGEPQVAAELALDGSAAAERAAALARAAVPTATAKARAWRAVVTDGTLTNAQQQATIDGFVQVHELSLLRPWVGPYFDALEPVWSTRSNELAQGVVDGLFPHRLAGDPQVDLLAETDRWLAGHRDAPAALRRLVTEQRDAVVRSLHAQAADRT